MIPPTITLPADGLYTNDYQPTFEGAFFVIVVPSGALWGELDESLWVWLVILVAFAAFSIGVYWWFKAHPSPEDAEGPVEGPVDDISEAANDSESAAVSVTGSRQTKS